MKILLSIFLFSFILSAQQSALKHITINDGLSQNFIYSIYQDAKGFIWFGTKDGLNRYDGYTFRIYRKDNADTTSLTDNTVTAIHQTVHDRLWIGTAAGGVVEFDQRRSVFRKIQHPFPSIPPLREHQINVISSTRDGRILIGSAGAGLFIYDPVTETWQVFRSDSAKTESLYGNSIVDVAEDSAGTIWVAANGLNVIAKDGRISRVDRGQEDPLSPGVNRISALYCDPVGRMWVSFRNGIDLYSGSSVRHIFTASNENNYYWMGKIRRASNGVLWTTSVHHLHRIDPKTFDVQVAASFNEERISGGFAVDGSDNVWVGTGGWGAVLYNPRTDAFGKRTGNYLTELFNDEFAKLDVFAVRTPGLATFDPGMRGNEFRTPFRSTSGDLFIATSDAHIFRITAGGAVRRHLLVPENTPDRKSHAPTAIFEDSTHTVWIIRNNGLVRFEDRPQLFGLIPLYPDSSSQPNSSGYTDITAVTVTRDGMIWFGTPTNGLLKLDPNTFQKTWYHYREFDPNSISHNHVLSIAEDPNSPERFLWIGTDGGGLNRLDRRSGTFTAVNEHHGFPNNTVYGILTDERKTFWISTNKGLVNFNPADGSMKKFDVYDGLQSNEFNRKEFFRQPGGRMIFGGVNGYNAFYPSKIVANNVVPKVNFTDLRLFNKPVLFRSDSSVLRQPIEFTEKIELNYSDNVVTIEFAAMEFTASAKNSYKYRLEGFDNDWIQNGTSRTATYTNIDPGQYTFCVKAANGDGMWNEEPAKIILVIRPPFWWTWWFLTIVSLIFLSTGPIIYYLRVSGLKKEQLRQHEVSRMLIESQESERKRIAQEMHDSLGQELLVIKNRALMGLKSVLDGSKEQRQLQQISEGTTNILKLVRSLSHNLRPPELDRLGLTETIRSILTNIREVSGKTLHAEVDEIDGLIAKENEINIIRILQESLSNIEKHSGASEITILVKAEQHAVRLEIRDNGKGFSPESVRHGIGLAGISERVRILGGSLSIVSTAAEGTTLSITLPVT
ncbi:MAG: ligand-binding sensor domain-containing protein [Bacteroidota bacterium]